MLTPEQLKGKIRNVAKEKNLSSQEILQGLIRIARKFGVILKDLKKD